MRCGMCKVDKLSREFPQEAITDKCNHPSIYCLRCIVKHVQQCKTCPYEECKSPVEPHSTPLAEINLRLKYLFPEYKTEYTPPVEGAAAAAMIRISTLTGDSIMIPYNPSQTVVQLKNLINQQTNHEVAKQKLLYSEQEMLVHKLDGSLAKISDYGVKPHSTVHLVVLLYAIPENFNHVVFDLFWGYPSTGCDYLDASCLAYAGQEFQYLADWSHNCPIASIKHSGDRMDSNKRIGHHTIEVELKNIPHNITHLFFTLSAWSAPNISKYPKPSLKFFEASNKTKDLCSTSFQHAKHSQAVIMCFVSRKGGAWQIYNSGKLSAGNATNYRPLKRTICGIISQGV